MGTFGVKRASDEKFCPSTLYSFCFVSTGGFQFSFVFLLGAEFAVFSPRVAEKGNSNFLAHFSSI